MLDFSILKAVATRRALALLLQQRHTIPLCLNALAKPRNAVQHYSKSEICRQCNPGEKPSDSIGNGNTAVASNGTSSTELLLFSHELQKLRVQLRCCCGHGAPVRVQSQWLPRPIAHHTTGGLNQG